MLYFNNLPYWQGAALYWFSFNSYLFIYSAVYKSVSLTILVELMQSPKKSLSISEITKQYIQPSFTERIKILKQAGYVLQLENRYQITAMGRKQANGLRKLQKLFGIRQSGLYTGGVKQE